MIQYSTSILKTNKSTLINTLYVYENHMFNTNKYDSWKDNPPYAHSITVLNDGMFNNHSMNI